MNRRIHSLVPTEQRQIAALDWAEDSRLSGGANGSTIGQRVSKRLMSQEDMRKSKQGVPATAAPGSTGNELRNGRNSHASSTNPAAVGAIGIPKDMKITNWPLDKNDS